jgi:hypothetical protein
MNDDYDAVIHAPNTNLTVDRCCLSKWGLSARTCPRAISAPYHMVRSHTHTQTHRLGEKKNQDRCISITKPLHQSYKIIVAQLEHLCNTSVTLF